MTSSVSKLLSNFFSLSVLQIFNYAAPVVLIPYLTRILDIEEFAAVMIALSSVVVCYTLTDYGLSLSATHKISRRRDNKMYIDMLIARIFTAKILLVSFALSILFVISTLPQQLAYKHIFWAGALAIVAQAYQPLWLFHGLERMKNFAVYMAIVKLVHIALTVTLVSNSGDGVWVLVSLSTSNLLGTVISLYMARKLGYNLSFAKVSEAWLELRESFQFFFSRAAVLIYTSAGPIIVGMSNLQQAALYSTAEQGYKAGQAITSSVVQAMYPYMAKEKNWHIFFSALAGVVCCMLIGLLIVHLAAETIIVVIFGEDYAEAADVLIIMALTLVINATSALFGYPACAAVNKLKIANMSVSIGAAIFFALLLFIFSTNNITAISVAYAILIVEVIVLFIRLTFVALEVYKIVPSKNQ